MVQYNGDVNRYLILLLGIYCNKNIINNAYIWNLKFFSLPIPIS